VPKYSQYGQDLAAVDFFKFRRPGNRIFIDVGAFDGESMSNTRTFFELGWKGLCVEACRKNYDKLEKLYRGTGVVTVRNAVSDESGVMDLNIATIPGSEDYGSDVSSLSDETTKRWPNYKWEKERVEVRTLNEICETNGIGEVDFLSIDVEGAELKVLKGFDLDRYKPSLIVCEYGGRADRKKILDHLRAKSYFKWMDNGTDVFCIRGGRMEFLPLLFRSPKMYMEMK
jgi:FkbM family methyltransferase